MKKALIIIMVALVGMLSAAGASAPRTATEWAEKADAFYKAKKYGEAVKCYEEAVKLQPSATLWYNLGNARYRAGVPGYAVLAYERALRIDPTMQAARANLQFVNSRIADRPGQRGSFLDRKADNLANRATSDVWAWWAFGLFVLAAAGVVVYFVGSNVLLRKVGFFGSGVVLLLCIGALVMSLRARSIARDTTQAIVTARSSILSTVPREPSGQNEEAMMLHEGTKVEILDSVRPAAKAPCWYDVRIDNNRRAWINGADITPIYPF